jgi:hypothetical protein
VVYGAKPEPLAKSVVRALGGLAARAEKEKDITGSPPSGSAEKGFSVLRHKIIQQFDAGIKTKKKFFMGFIQKGIDILGFTYYT